MSKELVWSDEMEYVYGWASHYESKEDFIAWVKNQYEDGECEVLNVQIQPCIATEKGVKADSIVPLALTDVVIENFYTARVEKIDTKEIEELETIGWLMKVGDVFSNGCSALHLKITKIILDGDDSENAWIYCDMIDPKTLEKEGEDKHRAWYINDCWYK